jgi:glucose-1-phosphate thymidylyltransferase
VKQIVIVTSSSKPSIMEYFGNGSRFSAEVAYICQESFPEQGKSPGLSKALDGAYPWVRGRTVAFGMPDTIVKPSDCFVPLIEAVAAGADLALGLFPTVKPHKFGMVQIGSNSVVERIVDKPTHTDLKLMWGIIAWSPRFTDYFHGVMTTAPTDFASVMNGAIHESLVAKGIEISGGQYLDVGTYDDLARLSEFLAQ